MSTTKTAAAEREKILSWVLSYEFFTTEIYMAMPNKENCILEVLFLVHLSVLAHCITDTNSPKLNSFTCSNGKICFVHWPSEFLISCRWCDSGEEGSMSWSREVGMTLAQDTERCLRKHKINRKINSQRNTAILFTVYVFFLTPVCSIKNIRQSKHMLRDAAYL